MRKCWRSGSAAVAQAIWFRRAQPIATGQDTRSRGDPAPTSHCRGVAGPSNAGQRKADIEQGDSTLAVAGNDQALVEMEAVRLHNVLALERAPQHRHAGIADEGGNAEDIPDKVTR